MDTKTYVVTDRAGPKVAGRVAKKGDTLDLTEAEARAELLAGALRLEGDDGKTALEAAFKGSDKLADIRARAEGLEGAPPAPAESPVPKVSKAKAEKADAGKAETPPADTPPAA